MATPACFFRPFAWKIVFQPFTLRYCLSFFLRWISGKQQNVGSCLCSQSVSLCLFIGGLSPLILRDIKENNFWFLLFLLLELGFCICGCLLLGVLKDYFLAFSGPVFLPCIVFFLLLSFEGLDSWKDSV